MKNITKFSIVILLSVIVLAVLVLKQGQKHAGERNGEVKGSENTALLSDVRNLPLLLDLGAGKCIPCKMMEPILEELKEEYKEAFEVVFIDVWVNPEESKKYGIKLIPTQIFFDDEGNELFRHEGYFSREDILAKWEELGVK